MQLVAFFWFEQTYEEVKYFVILKNVINEVMT